MIGRSMTFAALLLAGAVLQAQQSLHFRYERPVAIDAPGPHRLAVDVPLLTGGNRFAQMQRLEGREGSRWRAQGGLSDLRLFEASGREVPYLLVYPDDGTPQWIGASVLPLAPTETKTMKGSGFEADLRAVSTVDMIQIEGIPAPFLKRLVLEGSGDRERWTLLMREGTLFDLPEEQLRQIALPFRAGPYRFLRVTWDDTRSGRVPPPRAVFARRANAQRPAAPPLTADATAERRPSAPGQSRYRITLPAAGLPVVALTLEVPGGHVFRNAVVTESALQGTRAVPVEIGRATLTRVVRDGVTASALRIPIRPPREAQLDLVVVDGNNPPLEVSRVHLEMAELPWIYFEGPAGPIARYGDRSAQAPKYDLEALRDSVKVADVPDARWGEPRESALAGSAAPAPLMPETGAPLDVALFRHRRRLPDTDAGLVAVPLDPAVLAHSRGPTGQFADVRVADESGRQVPYLLELLQESIAIDLPLERFEPRARELTTSGRTPSVYALQLPYANLPSATLVLETSARVFSRSVTAGVERPADRNRRDPWFETLASAAWVHAEQESIAAALSLPIPSLRERKVLIAVDEGDNSALPITSARALFPAYRLRLYHPGRGLQLLYGRDDLSMPRYDLALLAPQVMGAEAFELQAAPEDASADTPVPSFVSPRLFWVGLIVAVAVLAGLIVRLMRPTEETQRPPQKKHGDHHRGNTRTTEETQNTEHENTEHRG